MRRSANPAILYILCSCFFQYGTCYSATGSGVPNKSGIQGMCGVSLALAMHMYAVQGTEPCLLAPEDVGDQENQLGRLLAHPLGPGLHRVLLQSPLGGSLQGRSHECLHSHEPPLRPPTSLHGAPQGHTLSLTCRQQCSRSDQNNRSTKGQHPLGPKCISAALFGPLPYMTLLLYEQASRYHLMHSASMHFRHVAGMLHNLACGRSTAIWLQQQAGALLLTLGSSSMYAQQAVGVCA